MTPGCVSFACPVCRVLQEIPITVRAAGPLEREGPNVNVRFMCEIDEFDAAVFEDHLRSHA